MSSRACCARSSRGCAASRCCCGRSCPRAPSACSPRSARRRSRLPAPSCARARSQRSRAWSRCSPRIPPRAAHDRLAHASRPVRRPRGGARRGGGRGWRNAHPHHRDRRRILPRAAEEATLEQLAEEAGGVRVVLHCFSMPARLDECLERGYLLSFAGNVTYPSARELGEAARKAPLQALLAETDAPYLAPQAVRGQRNQPAFVAHTL